MIRQLDSMRERAGMSKADLARAIGKEPSAVRRLFTAAVNPELKTVAAVADARRAHRGSQPRLTTLRCGQSRMRHT